MKEKEHPKSISRNGQKDRYETIYDMSEKRN